MRERSGSVWRLRGRTVDTPVLWYRHQATGRTVVLVLNSHFGAASYFAAMAARLAELAGRGYAVQWEGITKAGPDEWDRATAAERAAHAVMIELYRTRPAMVAASLGWVLQSDALPIGDGWAHADLTDLEVVRLAGPDAILALGAATDKALARFGSHRDAYITALAPVTLRALARPHARLSKAIAATGPDVHAVLLGLRSRQAVAALDPGRDTAMVWGAEHADSIGAALGDAGWAPTGRRRWLEVGQLPPYWRSVAGVWAVAAAVGVETFRALQAADRAAQAL
jgi:hypothetical protein